jgi:hypothetical protein
MRTELIGWSNFAMVAATLLSGVVGALVTLLGNHFYSEWKDRKEKRERIFKTLMSTRGYKTGTAHVEALCAVEVEWGREEDTTVRAAWKAYNHHLNTQVPEDLNDPKNVAWRTNLDELFADLIVALGESIGKPQDKTEVKRAAYGPKAWGDRDYEESMLRRGFLTGGIVLPVTIRYEAAPTQAMAATEGQAK